ncbi:MAG: class I SAM-dependent methyltransferase, partial [Candidatus Paceibacterota bacterium]
MKRQTNENLNTPSAYDNIFTTVLKRDKDFDRSVDRKHKVILEKFNGGKLIDIGCLNSPLCIMAKEKFPDADITLLDFSPAVIDFYNKNYGFKTILADCRNIPVPDNTFDYAVAEEVLEHLE